MKRRDLIRLMERNGWVLKRHGTDHDIYAKGDKLEPVPRHAEINELLAKSIIAKHKLK